MDKAAMVSPDIDRGTELLDTLERAKVKVGVALWAFLSEYEDWRLIISARKFNLPDVRDAYGLLYDSLAPAGFTPRNTPPVMEPSARHAYDEQLRRVVNWANVA